jgi:ankyrin repeat protein
MATRGAVVKDLDAFFEQGNIPADTKERLNIFFRNTDPDFFVFANRSNKYNLFLRQLFYSNDIDSFEEFMNTFNISSDATITLNIRDQINRRYSDITAPLICFVTGIDGVFNKEFADYLLEKGANIHSKYTHPDLDPLMLTPLMSAAYYGSIDAVKYLVEHTEIRPADKIGGFTALTYAEMRRADIGRYIEDLEDDMDSANNRGERNYIQGRIEDLEWILREYENVIQYLRHVTPPRPEFENRNLQHIISQLRPNLKTAIEALSVKGVPRRNNQTQRLRIPRNVMGHLAQMLPRRHGIRIAPVNTGLKHVQTNLFTNSPTPVTVNQNAINEPTNLGRIKSNLLQSTRRIKKTRKARKSRSNRNNH